MMEQGRPIHVEIDEKSSILVKQNRRFERIEKAILTLCSIFARWGRISELDHEYIKQILNGENIEDENIDTPLWPYVRCIDCGTKYEIDEPIVTVTINNRTMPIIQNVCPNCNGNKFKTQMWKPE